MLYRYRFITQSDFTPPVSLHFFKLRCLSMECECQRIVSSSVEVEPEAQLSHAVDGFGNRVQYGGYEDEHSRFRIKAEGVVECIGYFFPDSSPADYYLSATPLTAWDENISEMARGKSAEEIMRAVHSAMKYQRFVTDNTTIATEAWQKKAGVCQDFAHIMLAACRSVGIHARYVCGLIAGEGETHAWVEVHDGRQWLGYDPTYCRKVEVGYIKFAHGRDANDCPINRGRFYSWTNEVMRVNSKVENQ